MPQAAEAHCGADLITAQLLTSFSVDLIAGVFIGSASHSDPDAATAEIVD
jgi:hypothetical protein